MQEKLNSGTFRAISVFVFVALFLWMIFFMLDRAGINFFAEPILIFIGAGWSAYWVWKKTEYGRY